MKRLDLRSRKDKVESAALMLLSLGLLIAVFALIVWSIRQVYR